jgi:hypothetical protein
MLILQINYDYCNNQTIMSIYFKIISNNLKTCQLIRFVLHVTLDIVRRVTKLEDSILPCVSIALDYQIVPVYFASRHFSITNLLTPLSNSIVIICL